MIRSKNIDWYRHLSFAAVGGFFAAYAILLRMGIMANAQTLNLLELLLSSLRCHWSEVLMHLGALAMYVLGTMSTVILPHLFGWDMRRVCPIIDALCAVLLAFLPAEMPVIPSLYPIFFAMSVQWSSFTGAQDHISSTIFSTNNTKQASLSLARHLCTREQGQIRRMWFYVSTILCFCGSHRGLLFRTASGGQRLPVCFAIDRLGLLHGGVRRPVTGDCFHLIFPKKPHCCICDSAVIFFILYFVYIQSGKTIFCVFCEFLQIFTDYFGRDFYYI